MITSAIAYLALAKTVAHAPFVEGIDVTVNTGEDDLRGDSGAMIIMQYSDSRHQIAALNPGGASLSSNSSKTVHLTPNVPNLTVGDLERIRVDFSSGKGTGFDDHWSLQGVTVTATVGGNPVTIYSNRNLGMHLMYTQHWSSPFFATSAFVDTINPSDFYAVIEGGDNPPARSTISTDLETEDGQSWQGNQLGSQMADTRSPGARVESSVYQKIPVKSIRAFRIKCEGTPWNLRGIRFMYKTADGSVKEFASFNEISVPMQGGWYERIFKPLKRQPGVPVHGLIAEVMTGADDLRRMNLPPTESARFNSKIDLKITPPIWPGAQYPNWLVNGDNVRHVIARTQPMMLQDGDEFPEGWTGSFKSGGKFQKTWRATGTPYFLSSDFANMQIQFKQGQGGNLLPSDRASDGIINGLLGADQWDLQGVIISVIPPSGPVRRIYSNFAINQRMNSNDQIWKSKNFDTLLLRARPN